MQKRDNKKENPKKQMEDLVEQFLESRPYVKDVNKNNEFEIRFGTRGIKPMTKIDYDNVIRRMKSLGFNTGTSQNLLRIQSEFLDATTGAFRSSTASNIRTEITGFHAIQEYCQHNDINKVANIAFYKKDVYKNATGERLFPVNFDDFNFRCSFQVEDRLSAKGGIIRGMKETWSKTKKSFRFINRVSFQHADLPVQVDMSIVKTSDWDMQTKGYKMAYTTEESGVFRKPETFEIELEVINDRVGPGTAFVDTASLVSALQKTIKYVLQGLQGTNYPVSYPEQKQVLDDYLHLIQSKKLARPNSSQFIGPNSYTLQTANIAPINPDANIPNIRNDYTVTDKADGERHLMYIHPSGKIYLISVNMQILFTGSTTSNKEIINSLVDGEWVLHNKLGNYINLYMAFDLYFLNGKDVRFLSFVPRDQKSDIQYRLPLLKRLFHNITSSSSSSSSSSSMRFDTKKFYPVDPKESIFSACHSILIRERESGFEYNTDGLIFTPATFGVGAGVAGKAGPLRRIVWEHSFKWKPAEFNTIDFLVRTVKENGMDRITPLFQEGIQVDVATQITQYKSLILAVGYDPNQHGYLNPCQDVLEDKLTTFQDKDVQENLYQPAQFVPTNPSDPLAGTAQIILRKDDTGTYQLFTEEGQVFEDNTIVEFRYDMTEADRAWRWKPLRLRYDKTARYKQGFNEFGNAYNVADSNWRSIHNPVTVAMITTGEGIPNELADDDIYYNRFGKSFAPLRGLRDFHNLFVKKKLITSVSKPDHTLIDYACGKGGDFPKWIEAKLSFVFGVDIARDNLENRIDGACARFLNYRKDFKTVPYALFVNGNSAENIRSGRAALNDKAKHICRAIFEENVSVKNLGPAVERQFGKGAKGFHVSSCQFALHYFFENHNTLRGFLVNVAECTALGGYFIGTCYDGKKIFNRLRGRDRVEIYDGNYKIWEIRKEYQEEEFPDTASSVGYKIGVFQESINKMFPEYLVNFAYLNRLMEAFGFHLLTREEAKDVGLPEGSGLFIDLYNAMMEETRRKKENKNLYGKATTMSAIDCEISFLNRYFVYKKMRNVNAEKVVIDLDDEDVTIKTTPVPEKKARKPRKLKTKVTLQGEEEGQKQQEEKKEVKSIQKKGKQKGGEGEYEKENEDEDENEDKKEKENEDEDIYDT